jgi:hypothetical protein
LEQVGDRFGNVGKCAALDGFHDENRNAVLGQEVVAISRVAQFGVQIVDLNLCHIEPVVVFLQEFLKIEGVVVEREPDIFDLTLGLLLLEEVVEAEFAEGFEFAAVHVVDKVEVKIVRRHLLIVSSKII